MANKNIPSIYQKAWDRLKEIAYKSDCKTGKSDSDWLTLFVYPEDVAKVLKAVKKRKYLDLAFKFANETDPLILVSEYDSKTHKLKLRLRQTYGTEPVVAA